MIPEDRKDEGALIHRSDVCGCFATKTTAIPNGSGKKHNRLLANQNHKVNNLPILHFTFRQNRNRNRLRILFEDSRSVIKKGGENHGNLSFNDANY
jgi:hypothetical protein